MDPYIGEIRLFAGNYAPQDWLMCNGQELQVNQYQTLYSLMGNAFGGTANVTFKLPNLSGKAPIHRGVGKDSNNNNLTPRDFASTGGVAGVTLTSSQMPSHQHIAHALNPATGGDPSGTMWATSPRTVTTTAYGTPPNVEMNPATLTATGGGQAHNNMQPYVAINYIICYSGIYPDLNS